MRKGRDGGEKNGGEKGEKTDDYSGHYVIASSQPPKCQPLERRTLVPITKKKNFIESICLRVPDNCF